MTLATTPTAPAGWYPQPDGSQLYWDGEKWDMSRVPQPASTSTEGRDSAVQASAGGYTLTRDDDALTIHAKGVARLALRTEDLRLPYSDIPAFAHKSATKFGQGILLIGTEHGRIEIRYRAKQAQGFDEIETALAAGGIPNNFEVVHSMRMFDPNRERLRAERAALRQDMRDLRSEMKGTLSTRAAFADQERAHPAAPTQNGHDVASVTVGRAEKAAIRDAFQHLALAAAHGDATALAQLPTALEETRAYWRPGKLDSTLWATLVEAIDYVGQDDVLTTNEEAHLAEVADALGLTWAGLRENAPTAFERLVVCRINDGRPPTLANPLIMTRPGENAYGEFSVALMKEVVQREFRGGSSGISIPLGLGIRYRTGAVRGRSVVVGSELVAADHGTLVVTSDRAVFTGSKRTLEFRHDKLVGIQQYTDGLRLNVSNRQTASLFKFGNGQSPTIASALITHAVATAG